MPNHRINSGCQLHFPLDSIKHIAVRELDHPNYDFVHVASRFPYTLQPNQWLAVKMVSYVMPDKTRTRNLLYLDIAPFTAEGKPANNFRLYTEWYDVNGASTGRYTQAALWAGWVNTFRVDGWRTLDFATLAAREIVPPAN